MRFYKLAASVAALSMVAAPVVAQANPASSLSLANAQPVRSATKLKKSSKAAPIVIVLAVVVGLAGLGLATGVIGDDDSN